MFTDGRLTRLAGLALIATLVALPGRASHHDYLLDIPDVPGESSSLPAGGFDIKLGGEGPGVLIALLLPAVQKVREAAARTRLLDAACDGSVIPAMTLDVMEGGRIPSQRYELRNVIVTGVGWSGQADAAPTEQFSLNFEEVTFTNLETGETRTYACTSGRCVCAP